MSEAYPGQIVLFAGNYAPKNWALCNGQVLSISANSALFAVIGNVYGGDGRTTFALPDLRSRVPVAAGNGTNLSPYAIGATGGVDSVTLTTNQMPLHTHLQAAAKTLGTTDDPTNAYLAQVPDGQGGVAATFVASPGAAGATMNSNSISPCGNSQPHTNLQPFLALNYIICVQDLYPSRN